MIKKWQKEKKAKKILKKLIKKQKTKSNANFL